MGGIWLYFNGWAREAVVVDLAWLLSLFDIVLITLASTQLSDQALSCSLEGFWKRWFQEKNSRAISDVQTSLGCCGFRSPIDRAWPFPDKAHGVDACQVTYDRNDSCLPGWSREARNSLNTFIITGVVILFIKVVYTLCPRVLFRSGDICLTFPQLFTIILCRIGGRSPEHSWPQLRWLTARGRPALPEPESGEADEPQFRDNHATSDESG